MLHRRPAITWANCDQVYQRIYESSNLNVLIWWKCMVSYCRYHNGRTFIISCWRAWKVYANYICYILGRSLSCLIFCNYDSPQNWTWRMWSYILSVNIVLSIPQNYIIVGRRVTWKHGANCMAIYCMPYIWKCDKRFIGKLSSQHILTRLLPQLSTFYTLYMQLLKGCKCNL